MPDEPLYGNDHLPEIQIIVSQACVDYRNQPKELILVNESQQYALAIFNALMMMTNVSIHQDTDAVLAIQTLGYLGKTFTDIAITNLELLEVKDEQA